MVVAAAGCGSQATVRSQTTPGTDFRKYHSYAIKPGTIVYPGATEAQRTDIEKRIQDAVAAELEGRGLTPQPDEPELIITYTAGARQQDMAAGGERAPVGVDIRSNEGGYDEPGQVRAREWPDAAADIQSRNRYTEGNLVIDLLDGKSRKLVWRATANLELASDRGGKQIPSIVAKAFQGVPLGQPSSGN